MFSCSDDVLAESQYTQWINMYYTKKTECIFKVNSSDITHLACPQEGGSLWRQILATVMYVEVDTIKTVKMK